MLQQTRTIPIVFALVADPVGSGFVASFPRPGGNITGFISNEPTMSGKWLELLKEIAPRVYRRAASYADRILKGSKPDEIPVQAPGQIRTDDQSQDRQDAGPRRALDSPAAR
jgi:ABC-type uncharacterized transport system substrate-binding protein